MSNRDADAVRIEHRPAESQFLLSLDGVEAARLDYRSIPGGWDLQRTVTRPEFRGHGHAGALVAFALDRASEQGLHVVPTCSYVAAWIERHPAYARLVEPSP